MLKRAKLTLTLILLLSGFLQCWTHAQTPIQREVDWNQRLRDLSGRRFNSGSYPLGPGDLVEVSVFGVDSLKQVLRVSDEGQVNFPLLGAIAVSGLTPTQMEEKISEQLSQRELVQNPQVTVLIQEYRSQPIFVLGAVGQPGQYQMTYPLRLIDALVLAGGIQEEVAGDSVIIQRFDQEEVTSGAEDEAGIIEIDLNTLLAQGGADTNLQLKAGDVIRVTERAVEVFYLIGEVGRPGVYELPSPQTLYLTQALAHAGGPLKTAKTSKGVLVRYDQSGGRTELAVDVRRILTGKDPDFEIQANDVIYVPGSASKSILYGMLGVIPRTFSDTVTRGPNWRRARNP